MEQYISRRVIEKVPLPCLRDELPRLHANNVQMLPEEAEMEFLKVPLISTIFEKSFQQINMIFSANVFTVDVFCALLDCPAAPGVWGPVSQSWSWKETCYWRADIGNLCQRNYGLRSQEQLSYIKPQFSLVRDGQSFNKCKFTVVFVYFLFVQIRF